MSNTQPDDPSSGLTRAVVAVAAGIAGLLGSYGAVGFAPGFVVAPVERTLSQVMPGQVVALTITVLGDLGQQLNLVAATGLVVTGYALLVGLVLVAGRRADNSVVVLAGAPAAVWAVTAAVTGRPVASLGAAAGVAVVVAVVTLARADVDGGVDASGRRSVLSAVAAAAGVSAVGLAFGRDSGSTTGGSTGGDGGGGLDAAPGRGQVNDAVYGGVETPTFEVDDLLAAAEERTLDVGGAEPLVSRSFYNVDISSVDPEPDAAEWTLSVTGEVEESFELDYGDLRDREFVHQFSTLRCVGESLNGRKTDTALWSGVPLAPLIERASPNGDCDCVLLRADDDYFQEFPVEALESGMLVLGMNGGPLPRAHGAPVRALIPGHWGEINVKWITEIEFLDEAQKGYWEQRGWHGTGPVKTVAKLHATTRTDDGQLLVGGHAYAGLRGIEAVEVSTDGGDTWSEAELSEPLPGASGAVDEPPERAADAWRQWRYTYDADAEHEAVVRARERTGELQTETETGKFPSGPSGWVSREIDPDAV